MKFLQTSDWHLGKTFHEVNLYEDQQFFLDQIFDELKKEKDARQANYVNITQKLKDAICRNFEYKKHSKIFKNKLLPKAKTLIKKVIEEQT